jgi:hypothetical protein
MGLSSADALPTGISPVDAYTKIRTWYQAHLRNIESRGDDYAKRSTAYIRAMPAPSVVSPQQMQDAFNQVLAGLLEWAYHESDGFYKMAAYASVASE